MGILILIAIAIAAFCIYIYQSEASTNTLRDLLAAGKWESANKETDRLLRLTTNRNLGLPSKLERSAIDKYDYIPCSILRTIDQLWVQYSDGRFGFSIQLNILEECKKADDWKKKEVQEFESNNSKIFCRLAKQYSWGSAPPADPVEVVMFWERIGWLPRDYTSDGWYTYCRQSINEFNYSRRNAPKGYLPVFDNNGTDLYMFYTLKILLRLKDCGGYSVDSAPQAPIAPYPQAPGPYDGSL